MMYDIWMSYIFIWLLHGVCMYVSIACYGFTICIYDLMILLDIFGFISFLRHFLMANFSREMEN